MKLLNLCYICTVPLILHRKLHKDSIHVQSELMLECVKDVGLKAGMK